MSVITILMNKFLDKEIYIILLPFMIGLVFLQVVSISNYGYHINQALFPVLVRGQSYGVVNFVSRPFAAGGTILTEYTSEPINFVVLFSFLMLLFTQFI